MCACAWARACVIVHACAREPTACMIWRMPNARVRGRRRRRWQGARDCRAAPHTHSFSPALICAPLTIYHSIPKRQSQVHVAIAPAKWGYLGVAVLGVAVLGTAVLGVAVLGTAVLGVAVLGTAVLGVAVVGVAVGAGVGLHVTRLIDSSRCCVRYPTDGASRQITGWLCRQTAACCAHCHRGSESRTSAWARASLAHMCKPRRYMSREVPGLPQSTAGSW